MIALADTSVSRNDNLYRFQTESYLTYDIMRVYKNEGRKGSEKRFQTIYDDEGYAYVASKLTGEILRRKKPFEIKRSVDISLNRTRRVVREIVMSNKWSFFGTLTFNNEMQDRTDDKAVLKQFLKWRKACRRKFPEMFYLLVPERHKDGCLHFHIIVGGVSESDLGLVDSGHKDKKGRAIYNATSWQYGFSDLTRVDDTEKVSGYILKYIGKDMGVNEENKKRYWASRSCARPKKEYVDFTVDEEEDEDVMELFEKFVEPSIGRVVMFYHKGKNYIAVRDNVRGLRRYNATYRQLMRDGKIGERRRA